MAEFCSSCPEKGSCVGEVEIDIERNVLKESPITRYQYYAGVVVEFSDEFGMKSTVQMKGISRADLPDTSNEILENILMQRIDICNGSAGEICPAVNPGVLESLVERERIDEGGQTDPSVIK